MSTIVNLIFALELALLCTHEMDSIRNKEWKMFIFLKDLSDKTAYQIFMLLHIPLYGIIIFLLLSSFSYIGYYITDIFLVAHLLLHIGFKKHPANKLNNSISQGIIFSSGILASLHLVLFSTNWLY